MVHKAVAMLLITAGLVVLGIGFLTSVIGLPGAFLESFGAGSVVIGIVILLIGAKVEGE